MMVWPSRVVLQERATVPSPGQNENCTERDCLGKEAGEPNDLSTLYVLQCFASPLASRVRPMGSTVSAYLPYPCLQNLEPCLCFQFRLHQPCRKEGCKSGSSQHHAGWKYFKGASSQA